MLWVALLCILRMQRSSRRNADRPVCSWTGSAQHTTLTIWLAVLAVYALDFAINGVQATDRALIVDLLPVSQQEEANAWVARL